MGKLFRNYHLKEVWETRFEKNRTSNWLKTGECEHCDMFRYYDGNGLHLRDEKNGELLFCHFNRISEGEKINANSSKLFYSITLFAIFGISVYQFLKN